MSEERADSSNTDRRKQVDATDHIKRACVDRHIHGGGRMWFDDHAAGERHLIADFYGDGEYREHILALLGHAQPVDSATYKPPPQGWVCFHCGEHFAPTFSGHRDAQRHFGASIHSQAACLTKQEKGLLVALREVEVELGRHLSEDTDLHREIARLKADHTVALMREEEKGYERGLRDAGAKMEEQQ